MKETFRLEEFSSWTLNFTMKAYYFGPTSTKRVIKFTDANIFTSTTATTAEEQVNVQPGSTAANVATTKIAETVAYSAINVDDNWAEIVQILDA